ncbi:MAG: hypothetical protein ABIM99_01425 [Candidatus Dojkabacteria bacterium]
MNYLQEITTDIIRSSVLNTPQNIAMPLQGNYGRTWQALKIPSDLMTKEYFEELNKYYINLIAKLVSLKFLDQEPEELVKHVALTMQRVLSDNPSDLDINVIDPEIYTQILLAAQQIENSVRNLVTHSYSELDFDNVENLFSKIEENITLESN